MLEPTAVTEDRYPITNLCLPANVVVMKVHAQPTEVAAQGGYLDQPSAGQSVAQALAEVALVVRETALKECQFPPQRDRRASGSRPGIP